MFIVKLPENKLFLQYDQLHFDANEALSETEGDGVYVETETDSEPETASEPEPETASEPEPETVEEPEPVEEL